MNTYKKAIELNESKDFLLGRNKYFVLNRDWGDHDISGTYMEILNFGMEHGEQNLYSQITEDINKILLDDDLTVKDFTNLLGIIFFYYVYRKDEKKFKTDWQIGNNLKIAFQNKLLSFEDTEDLSNIYRILDNLKKRFDFELSIT